MQFEIISFMCLWTSEKVTLIVAAFSPYSDEEKGRCFWSSLLTSAGCGHTFQLCARNHVCLWEQRPYISDPQDSWTSLPPASTTGWYNYLFHYHFFFFTHLNIFGLFFFTFTSGHGAELTEVPAQAALVPEAVQATGSQGVGWGV